jgi:hypothetical protein
MKESTPCDGLNTFCSALSNRLQDDHKKGFCYGHVVNIETGEDCPPLILYRRTSSDVGILLNFCPFCGNRLNKFTRLKDMENNG